MNIKNLFLTGLLSVSAACSAFPQSPVQGKDNPRGVLSGRNIALWQSHGRFFDRQEDRWKWQRCRLFGTVEDLYTRSYVVPFLVPMLENAGAYVLLPRERDANSAELIIDPDGAFASGHYAESNGKHKWQPAPGPGFGYAKTVLSTGDNPFAMGSARQVRTVREKDADRSSSATWNAEIPAAGSYAVYVSYPKLEKAVPDARYVVHTASGPHEFTVNQQMGAGTWIYLGTFPFNGGLSDTPLVELSNVSAHSADGALVGADAVRIGGGMGNVSRSIPGQEESARVSGMPRWAEGARYYLQWAGMPDSVYTYPEKESDYWDDIFSRPQWVNYMMQELNVPVDLVMAFHSDAGITPDDTTTIGTLGIYYTYNKKGRYADGRSRLLARDLCDDIVSSVVSDIRALHNPNWTRRRMRDRTYVEARVAEVPTMLLEALAHQNFADMKLGLDPQFKFDVSRAVYKGILRYLSSKKLARYVVQPLPVQAMSLVRKAPSRYLLSWEPAVDPLEATAYPTSYIIERRSGLDPSAPFIPTDTVRQPQLAVDIPAGSVESFRVIALNDGGHSFPSEVLAAGEPENSKGLITVVNGFTRVSAPDSFSSGTMAGFGLSDPGVPMGVDLSYTGPQYDFNRLSEWAHDDQPGFGASRATMETRPVYGNSFDFVLSHGASVMAAGYAFESQSALAFSRSAASPLCVDLLLGLQRGPRHPTFPLPLQQRIDALAQQGVPFFVSGSYVASDSRASTPDSEFLRKILGIEWRTDRATAVGMVSEVKSPLSNFFGGRSFTFPTALGSKPYAVTAPDAIYPTSSLGATIMRYDENLVPAAVAFSSPTHRAVTLGFPFEAVETASARNLLMRQILNFLLHK